MGFNSRNKTDSAVSSADSTHIPATPKSQIFLTSNVFRKIGIYAIAILLLLTLVGSASALSGETIYVNNSTFTFVGSGGSSSTTSGIPSVDARGNLVSEWGLDDNYILAEDILINSFFYGPIGGSNNVFGGGNSIFTGSFDGNGHTITIDYDGKISGFSNQSETLFGSDNKNTMSGIFG
jgi:hypothetical protein